MSLDARMVILAFMSGKKFIKKNWFTIAVRLTPVITLLGPIVDGVNLKLILSKRLRVSNYLS